MIRAIRLILLILLTAIILALSVANRQNVGLRLDPLDGGAAFALQAPLYLIILLSVIAGVAIGACAMWMGQGRWRRQAKLRGAEAQKLKKDMALMETEMAGLKRNRLRA